VDVRDFNFWYGSRQILRNLTFALERKAVTAIIGPSGCGKSTFLRSVNRLNDLIPGTRHTGDILLEGRSVFGPTDLVTLRQRVGMVFQRPNPFPKSIYTTWRSDRRSTVWSRAVTCPTWWSVVSGRPRSGMR